MPVLLLDNFLDTKFSDWYSQYCHDDLVIMRASEGEFPEDLTRFSHLILSGSEESIVNDRDWVETEMELVREALQLKLPTLGICYGHQLIARALLGPSGVCHSQTPEFGWIKVSQTVSRQAQAPNVALKTGEPPSSILSNLPASFHIYNAHFDEVCDLDDRFQVLASSKGCAVQAFQVKGAPIWGLQFHPEIGLEMGIKYLRTFPERYPDHPLDVEATIAGARDDEVSEKLFRAFYSVRRED